MPSIEIPHATGVLPDVRVNYAGPLVLPATYSAQIIVVGTYTEPAGYGSRPETYTVQRTVWTGDVEYEDEEAAAIAAVEKLAEMIGRLA